jgi:hypothetical protein
MNALRIGSIALALVVLIGGVILLTASGRQGDVEQPIAFSHKKHVSDNQIPCLYCHGNARRSAVAGIPSVQRCMGCHRGLKVNTSEIKKLKLFWKRREPIRWIRVYDQPDFVHFSHKRHVRKGIACQTCHGEVRAMEQVRKAVVLNMDRCIDCHLKNQASIDCVTCHK